jgi:hypothetical protein
VTPLPEFWEVGRRFQLREPAGYDDVPGFGRVRRVFEQDSFGSSVGNTVPLRIAGEIVGWARVCDAEVPEDGSSVLFTYEVTQVTGRTAQAGGVPLEIGTDDSKDTQ